MLSIIINIATLAIGQIKTHQHKRITNQCPAISLAVLKHTATQMRATAELLQTASDRQNPRQPRLNLHLTVSTRQERLAVWMGVDDRDDFAVCRQRLPTFRIHLKSFFRVFGNIVYGKKTPTLIMNIRNRTTHFLRRVPVSKPKNQILYFVRNLNHAPPTLSALGKPPNGNTAVAPNRARQPVNVPLHASFLISSVGISKRSATARPA